MKLSMWSSLMMLVLLAPVPARQMPATGVDPAPRVTAQDPDRLYEAREDLASALEAAAIWDDRLKQDPRDFEAAWKLARAAYWIGAHVPEDEKRREYERGLDAGRQAVALEPDRPEGRFWMAATMGGMAESLGLRAGIRYRGAIRRELEAVLRIAPGYLAGAADRALGRWHFQVPWLFGGRRQEAIAHLERSLSYDPDNAASHFFLAEIYLDADRHDDARRELLQVLETAETVEWGPEIREFKRRATTLLETRLSSP